MLTVYLALKSAKRNYTRDQNMTTAIKPHPLKSGIYQHYKGPKYKVEYVATHSETEEPLVIYQALYGEFGMWARPLSMFLETVEVNGKTVPRFAYLSDAE